MSQHPKGLYLLFMTEMAERFSYYGMRSLFTLYLIAAFFTKDFASEIYGSYTGLVYLTPLIGGYIADRYWGNRRSIILGGLTMALGQFLLFVSACLVRQSKATALAEIDPSVDNSLSLIFIFLGIATLIIGNGFFKPNISTMVGELYEDGDHRRDSAFTIFYMGINVGAFFAPLWCGFVGEGSATNLAPFKWGFLSACIAMLISVCIFYFLKDKYLVTPDGKAIGAKPQKTQSETVVKADNNKSSKTRMWICVGAMVVLFVLFSWGSERFTDYISSAIYACGIAMPVFIITDPSLTRIEKDRIGVIYIIAVFVIFFWAAFEQAGVTLTYFAAEQTDRMLGSWEMPASWFQVFNPIFVVIFAPIMATLWQWLSRRGVTVFSPTKQAIGLMLLALGYVVISIGVRDVAPDVKVSMFWLITLYLLQTLGELTLSPIGLSMVSKLSPRRMASLLMGVWFMSNAASNILCGKLATLYPSVNPDGTTVTKTLMGIEIATMDDFFMIFAVMAAVASVLLFAACPLLKKMMHGIE